MKEANLRLVTFGDIQEQTIETERIIEIACALKPDISVVLGDLLYDASDIEKWNRCVSLLEPLSRVSEIWTVPGNHDYEGPQRCENFKKFFRRATEETHVSLARNGCRMLMIDTSLDSANPQDTKGYLAPDSLQTAWLRRELDAAKRKGEVRLVFGHHPVFVPQDAYETTSPTIRVTDRGEDISPGNLLPLLLEYEVHVYFAGHIHFYERSEYGGTTFITAGATGCPFFTPSRDGNRFAQVRFERNHLCLFEAKEGSLLLTALDESGNVFDRWEKAML